MASIQKRITVAAGATETNVLVGSEFEIPERPSRVTLYAVGEDVGLVQSFSIGSRNVLRQGRVKKEALAGRGPLIPEDAVTGRQVAATGQRTIIEVANPTAGDLDYDFIFEITPIPGL